MARKSFGFAALSSEGPTSPHEHADHAALTSTQRHRTAVLAIADSGGRLKHAPSRGLADSTAVVPGAAGRGDRTFLRLPRKASRVEAHLYIFTLRTGFGRRAQTYARQSR